MGLISILQSVDDNLEKRQPICWLYMSNVVYIFYHICKKEKSGRVCSISESIGLYLNACQQQNVVEWNSEGWRLVTLGQTCR